MGKINEGVAPYLVIISGLIGSTNTDDNQSTDSRANSIPFSA
jgi:hypothetical protein